MAIVWQLLKLNDLFKKFDLSVSFYCYDWGVKDKIAN